jgi:hypothetical protein
VTARVTIRCDAPDCPAEVTPTADDDSAEVPAPRWLRVHAQRGWDGESEPYSGVADYCSWACYATDVTHIAMEREATP